MESKKFTLLIIFVIFTLLFSFWFFYLRTERDRRLIKKGNIIVEKIEEFKNVHGRLPDDLSEIGIPDIMGGIDTLYYDKYDDFYYTISFGQGLGDSTIFRSDIMQWVEN